MAKTPIANAETGIKPQKQALTSHDNANRKNILETLQQLERQQTSNQRTTSYFFKKERCNYESRPGQPNLLEYDKPDAQAISTSRDKTTNNPTDHQTKRRQTQKQYQDSRDTTTTKHPVEHHNTTNRNKTGR
eukprot:gb/GEZJ01001625.1/.p2 GENE.gb/GEZJ01001625.1/~~gb/GEZJ01001625.1/.p2  ORF type:complete len:132 (+),score=10.87 gb/GEZJ01001625.1/:173-568(+)